MDITDTEDNTQKRFAIRPYPRELEEHCLSSDGQTIIIRPIKPEDEPQHWEFIESLSHEDMRYRFFGRISKLPRSEMTRLTQIDYDREMAFIAIQKKENEPGYKTLGVVRAMTKPDNSATEFAIIVHSDSKRLGLGKLLMQKLISYCKTRKTKIMTGQALLDNEAMPALAKKMGFDIKKNFEEDVYEFTLKLTD